MTMPVFKAFGFEIPLTRAGLYALSIVVVLGVSAYGYRKLFADPDRALLTQRQLNQQQAFEIKEYGIHAMEAPTKHESFVGDDGDMAVRIYADRCVLIQRRSRDGVQTRLVPDLARRDIVQARQVESLSGVLPVVYAADACDGKCLSLSQHNSEFRQWFGERRKDGWVEVWRQWPHGCTHVQLFYPPTNAWDSNPDGTAKVRWTCCTHR